MIGISEFGFQFCLLQKEAKYTLNKISEHLEKPLAEIRCSDIVSCSTDYSAIIEKCGYLNYFAIGIDELMSIIESECIDMVNSSYQTLSDFVEYSASSRLTFKGSLDLSDINYSILCNIFLRNLDTFIASLNQNDHALITQRYGFGTAPRIRKLLARDLDQSVENLAQREKIVLKMFSASLQISARDFYMAWIANPTAFVDVCRRFYDVKYVQRLLTKTQAVR